MGAVNHSDTYLNGHNIQHLRLALVSTKEAFGFFRLNAPTPGVYLQKKLAGKLQRCETALKTKRSRQRVK